MAIAVFSAIQLVVIVGNTGLGDLAVESDFLAEIAPAAQQLAAGQLRLGDYPFKGPVSAAAVALLHGLTGLFGLGLFRTGVLLSLLCAGVTLCCVYRIGLILWGRRTAAAAVLLTATNNIFFTNSHKAGSDLLFLAMVMVCIYLTLTASAHFRRWILIGVLMGTAFLTRYIGIALPLWLVISLLVFAPVDIDRRDRLAAMGWAGLGFLFVVAPWLVFNLAKSGSLLTTRNLQNIAQEFFPTSTPAGGFGSLAALIGNDPGWFIAHYLGNIVHNVRDDASQVLGWAMASLSSAGLVYTIMIRPARSRLAFLVWAPVYALALGTVFYLARFSLPLIPVYALLAASLLDRLPRWTPLLALILMGVGTHFQADRIQTALDFYRHEQPLYLQQSIDYLQGRSAVWPGPDKPRLMGRKPHAAWYGRMEFVPYPSRLSGAADLLAYAAATRADFLVVGLIEHRFFKQSDFLAHLDSYQGVSLVFQADGNLVYQLNRKRAGSAFGTSARIDQLEALWHTALQAVDHDLISTIGTNLIGSLDRDGRLKESREVALRQLDFTDGDEELIVRLYIATASLKLGDPKTGIAVLKDHLGQGETSRQALPTAKGCLLLGRLYVESEDPGAGLIWLQRALDLYQDLGMEEEAEKVRLAIQTLGR